MDYETILMNTVYQPLSLLDMCIVPCLYYFLYKYRNLHIFTRALTSENHVCEHKHDKFINVLFAEFAMKVYYEMSLVKARYERKNLDLPLIEMFTFANICKLQSYYERMASIGRILPTIDFVYHGNFPNNKRCCINNLLTYFQTAFVKCFSCKTVFPTVYHCKMFCSEIPSAKFGYPYCYSLVSYIMENDINEVINTIDTSLDITTLDTIVVDNVPLLIVKQYIDFKSKNYNKDWPIITYDDVFIYYDCKMVCAICYEDHKLIPTSAESTDPNSGSSG